jgi:hypothetical protein
MGLLKKLLGGGRDTARSNGSASSQFQQSQTTIERIDTKNAPRRELVQVVLRDTMRKHAIPSDWIDCRILSVQTRKHKTGMHVQFIIRQGEDRLMDYVHAFQDTFWEELEKFEPRPREWLFSLAWQFEGESRRDPAGFVQASDGWDDDTQPPEEDAPPPVRVAPPAERPARPPVRDAQPREEEHSEDLQSDLQALYAIRDAALSQPADLTELPPIPSRGPGRS